MPVTPPAMSASTPRSALSGSGARTTATTPAAARGLRFTARSMVPPCTTLERPSYDVVGGLAAGEDGQHVGDRHRTHAVHCLDGLSPEVGGDDDPVGEV